MCTLFCINSRDTPKNSNNNYLQLQLMRKKKKKKKETRSFRNTYQVAKWCLQHFFFLFFLLVLSGKWLTLRRFAQILKFIVFVIKRRAVEAQSFCQEPDALDAGYRELGAAVVGHMGLVNGD